MDEPVRPKRKWQESVGTIIAMGKHLDSLYKDYRPAKVWEIGRTDFGIDASTVRKVIALSRHPVLSNPEYEDKLPCGWGTLYELKFLPEDFLIKKINEGTLEHVTKYEIWEWRGVKKNTKHPAGPHTNNKVHIDHNQSLVEYAREGMKTEGSVIDGDPVMITAKALGLSTETYRNVRALIILSERPELLAPDREFVIGLLKKIDKTRNVRPYYREAKPLVDKFFGVGKGRGFMSKSSHKRVEVFRNAIVILCDTCERVLEMEQPYMSAEDIDKSINELTAASKTIRRIAENLRRAKDV